MRYFGLKDSGLNPNSTLFYAIGIYAVIFVAASYVIPEFGASEYQGVLQHILRPMFLISAACGVIVGASISYLSTGKESGYMVGGFLVWLILTTVISGVYFNGTSVLDKAMPLGDRAKDRQEMISGSERWYLSLVDLHVAQTGSYVGLCDSLPNLVPSMSIGNIDFQQDLWETMKCSATQEAYVFSFGDTLTDWRWCTDSTGFTGKGSVNTNTVRCVK